MKLIILDRDGVINEDSDDFIKSPEEWIPIQGSPEAISLLNRAGWIVAVATNQSGVGRGLFDLATLDSIHTKMLSVISRYQASIDYLAWCPHSPDDGCHCRKPRPGLYKEISTHFKIELDQIPVIGDSKRDLEAAVAVGARPILVLSGKGKRTLREGNLPLGTEVFRNLNHAVLSILNRSV